MNILKYLYLILFIIFLSVCSANSEEQERHNWRFGACYQMALFDGAYKKSLEDKGKDHPDTIRLMYELSEKLAALSSESGETDNVKGEIACAEKAYQYKAWHLGINHPECLASMRHIIKLLTDAGDFQIAYQYSRSYIDKHDPDILMIMEKIPVDEQLYQEALQYYDKALNKEQSIAVVDIISKFAEKYISEKKYSEAEIIIKKAITLAEKNVINEQQKIFSLKNQLDRIYSFQQKDLELQQRALALQEQALKVEELKEIEKNVQQFLIKKDYAAAEPLYEKAVKISRKYLDKSHIARIRAIKGLASVYSEQKRYVEAESLLKEILPEVRLKQKEMKHYSPHIQPDDILISQVLGALGKVYENTERYKEAVPYYKESWENFKAVNQADNFTLLYQALYSRILIKTGDVQTAFQLLKEIETFLECHEHHVGVLYCREDKIGISNKKGPLSYLIEISSYLAEKYPHEEYKQYAEHVKKRWGENIK